jgi:hypothetical protein
MNRSSRLADEYAKNVATLMATTQQLNRTAEALHAQIEATEKDIHAAHMKSKAIQTGSKGSAQSQKRK